MGGKIHVSQLLCLSKLITVPLISIYTPIIFSSSHQHKKTQVIIQAAYISCYCSYKCQLLFE